MGSAEDEKTSKTLMKAKRANSNKNVDKWTVDDECQHQESERLTISSRRHKEACDTPRTLRAAPVAALHSFRRCAYTHTNKKAAVVLVHDGSNVSLG